MKRRLTVFLMAAVMFSGCGLGDGTEDTADTQPKVTETEPETEAETSPYAENPVVTAVYGYEYTGEYDEYIVSDSEHASDVVFFTDGTVGEFRLLNLRFEETDGGFGFSTEELYFHGDLTPEKGLLVKMMIPETIPYHGISYVDEGGVTHVYSVSWSGMDGSVYLSEIEPIG